MAVKDPLNDLLDSIAKEYEEKSPKPGEVTATMLSERKGYTWMVAKRILENKVREGTATKRPGMYNGRACDIYKPK